MGRWTQIRLHKNNKKKTSDFGTPKAPHNLFGADPFEDFF